MEVESEFLIANPFMKKVYDYALELGKTIIIITDMYSPRNFIEKNIAKNGHNNLLSLSHF